MSQKNIDKFKAEKKIQKKKNSSNKRLAQKIEHSLIDEDEDKKASRKKFKELLEYTKVFRDPVHGDIWITELENTIIDHPLFQRLRRIKQLGPTFLVYHGAIHTRFDHSLGTLFISQKIVDSIKVNSKNHKLLIGIFPKENFIIRIIALIHDMAHISWGHTIENEGNLIETQQWLNVNRRKKIINQIFPIIAVFLEDKGLEKEKDEILKKIENTLIAEEVGENDKIIKKNNKEIIVKGINSLKSPFIADIVGNTICADFLDYVARDCYFTGLKMVYDPRLFSYFARCLDNEGNSRVCILLERRSNKIRWDILNHCIDLLRMRYDLAQKVYHHRVKRNFSAVVIKMVYCAMKSNLLTEDELFQYGDDVIPYLILQRKNQIKPDGNKELKLLRNASENLAKVFINRKIYDIAHETLDIDSKQMDHLEKTYNDPENRYKIERIIEELFQMEPGSVIIYVSKKNTGKKAFVKMCRWNNEGVPIISPLERIAEDDKEFRTVKSQLTNLRYLYEDMWKFFVIIDRTNYTQYSDKEKLEKIIETICNRSITPAIDEIVDIIIHQECVETDLTVAESDDICKLAKEKINADPYVSTEGRQYLRDPIGTLRKIVKDFINNKNEAK